VTAYSCTSRLASAESPGAIGGQSSLGEVGVLDVEADGAHEGNGVRTLYRARFHAVIERKLAIEIVIGEVDVAGGGEVHGGEREVVGGDEAEGTVAQELADDGFGADAAVMRVGAAEDFVEQEKNGFSEREGEDLAEAEDLGVEAGAAFAE